MNAIERLDNYERDREYHQALDEARRVAELINVFVEHLRVDNDVLKSNIVTLYAQQLLNGALDGE